MPSRTRTPLVLISGIALQPSTVLADRFRSVDGTAVVGYCLREVTQGVVRRRLQLGRYDQLSVLELAHGCVSCTLREDLLPLLRKLAQRADVSRIVVRLDEAMEPEPVCFALENVLVGGRSMDDFVRLECVITVVDDAMWFDAVTGDVSLAERGLIASPEDDRTLAQVAISQVEFADVLVCAGRPSDTWTAARSTAVYDRIAPGTPRLPLDGLQPMDALAAVPAHARRGRLTDPHGPLLRGEPPLGTDCGVTTVLFTDHRPFHPERLHDAVDVLLDGVIRARGRAWVASQPDAALWLESAGGGLGIGHAGRWLAADGGPSWDDVPAERRALASLRWHPRFGDRAQELLVVAHRVGANEIEPALARALLTDDEIAAGPRVWATYHDPFGAWHSEPCADTEVSDARSDAARREEG